MQIQSLRKIFTAGLMFARLITSAQQKEILLWPNGAPGSEGKTGNEKIRLVEGEHVLSYIHRPSVTVYLPTKEKLPVQPLSLLSPLLIG